MVNAKPQMIGVRQVMCIPYLLTNIKKSLFPSRNIKNEGWSHYVYENK